MRLLKYIRLLRSCFPPALTRRRSATQRPLRHFTPSAKPPGVSLRFGVFAPQLRRVPLRYTPRRRRREEIKERGEGVWAVGSVGCVCALPSRPVEKKRLVVVFWLLEFGFKRAGGRLLAVS